MIAIILWYNTLYNYWSLTCRGDLSTRCGLERTPLASEALDQCCHVQYEVLSKFLDSYAVIKFNNQLKIFYQIYQHTCTWQCVTVSINIIMLLQIIFYYVQTLFNTCIIIHLSSNLLSFHKISLFPHIELS